MYIVYIIRNKYNNRVYVGSSKNFKQRKSTHFCLLKKGEHKNRRLQKDFKKFGGRDAFIIYPVCTAKNKETAYKFEQLLINGQQNPYNILKAGSAEGRKFTNTTLKRMSEAGKKRTISMEHIRNMTDIRISKGVSEITRKKIADAHFKRFENMEEIPHAKLGKRDVYEIHRQHILGTRNAELAKRFGVARTTISAVVKGRTWKRIYRELHSYETKTYNQTEANV